jgi:hypothetical protein
MEIIIMILLFLGVSYYLFVKVPENAKTMLLLFDALYETITDTKDNDFQIRYNELKSKYQDNTSELLGRSHVKKHDLFLLRRDMRAMLLDIKRKYPDLKTIVEVKTDGEIVLDTGVRI